MAFAFSRTRSIDAAEGDWLGLSERKTREPAGKARFTFRVGGNQK